MLKNKKVCLLALICIISIYFGAKFFILLFSEEYTAKSSFDEKFVDKDNSIVLKSSDLTEIQSEILYYASHEWKEPFELSYIDLYLDRNLKLSAVLFVYQLNDISNYVGRLEVKCNNDGNTWKIVRAETIYYYDEDQLQNSSEKQLKDDFLMQKIQAVTKFVESKEAPRVDLYLVNLNGNNIHIDAHNVGNENTQNNWRENCMIYQNESGVFIE